MNERKKEEMMNFRLQKRGKTKDFEGKKLTNLFSNSGVIKVLSR